MTKNQTLSRAAVTNIGEEIGFELGNQMVQDYQASNENDVHFYVIGRKIIDQILSQPGCAGIKFYNAYNEIGEKTMVYVGINGLGKAILEYSCINNQGILESNKGIVADRIDRGGGIRTGISSDDWNWAVD